MTCPKSESAMETVAFSTVEVDRCLGCGGLWLDALEADKLRAMKGSEAIDNGDAKKGREYNKLENIPCPHCGVKMLRMVDASQPHLWYESCPRCYGVYFDAGEFRDFKEQTILDWFRDLFPRQRT